MRDERYIRFDPHGQLSALRQGRDISPKCSLLLGYEGVFLID